MKSKLEAAQLTSEDKLVNLDRDHLDSPENRLISSARVPKAGGKDHTLLISLSNEGLSKNGTGLLTSQELLFHIFCTPVATRRDDVFVHHSLHHDSHYPFNLE